MSEPIKKSRRKTRQCLFQALYSCMYLQEKFDKEEFIKAFFDEDFAIILDETYFNEVFFWVQEKESELIYIVKKLAPKFDINSMPVINLIPIFISTYEQLFLKCDIIPFKVSIDEALELAKTYSDDQWRIFVNGVLNSLKDNKETILENIKDLKKTERSFFK
ncbi:MAG: Transcription antitermination protein NusB [uncultured bacterium (gcode 4)]|uniref:Transcription antitermination protein NusB n=1 Tax=uncultured bacterium (gcode 4) TaxID=1234023 RepID=K2GXA6_9BACT|nr:MAG: Transcription antitermination protein NusB [uncultured bacterium (gcode 4)]